MDRLCHGRLDANRVPSFAELPARRAETSTPARADEDEDEDEDEGEAVAL